MQLPAATTAEVLAFAEKRIREIRSSVFAARHRQRSPGFSRTATPSGCGLLTLEMMLGRADVTAVERLCDGLERFLMTVSWGG